MLRARRGEKCSCQDEADSKQRRCPKLMEPLGRIIKRIESGVKKALKHHTIPYHPIPYHTILSIPYHPTLPSLMLMRWIHASYLLESVIPHATASSN